MKQELLKGLTEQQIAKLKACKNQEEILAAVKEEGIELTEEQLEAVSGGGCGDIYYCPRCDKHVTDIFTYTDNPDTHYGRCSNCGYVFKLDW